MEVTLALTTNSTTSGRFYQPPKAGRIQTKESNFREDCTICRNKSKYISNWEPTQKRIFNFIAIPLQL